MKPITTAARFAKARATLGLSQAKLARVLGIHTQTISKIERGVIKLSAIQGLAIECLLWRSQNRPRENIAPIPAHSPAGS